MQHLWQKAVKNMNVFVWLYNVGCMMSYMDYGPRTLEEIINANMLVVKDH